MLKGKITTTLMANIPFNPLFMKNQRIISLYLEKEAYESGSVDITEKLHEIVPKDEIEGIKFIMPSSTETGIYFTIVLIEKKEEGKNSMGF